MRQVDLWSSRGRTRTCDPPVNSRLLYQLSYSGMCGGRNIVSGGRYFNRGWGAACSDLRRHAGVGDHETVPHGRGVRAERMPAGVVDHERAARRGDVTAEPVGQEQDQRSGQTGAAGDHAVTRPHQRERHDRHAEHAGDELGEAVELFLIRASRHAVPHGAAVAPGSRRSRTSATIAGNRSNSVRLSRN